MKTSISTIVLTLFTFSCIGQSIKFSEEQVERNLEHKFYHHNFNGGGVAFVDIDNDGDDDVYLTGGNRGDKLMINDGAGYFTDATEGTGLEITSEIYTAGITYGDIDNDGDKDFFVNTHAGVDGSYTYNMLFRNNGDMTFTNIWPTNTDKSMTMGTVFLDYDLDGDLDIYNVNYVDKIMFTYDDMNQINGFDHECYSNYMYRNNGDGTFTNTTNQLNLDDTGCALAVTASDYDNDGDLDILLGNDFGPFIQPNKLYRNDIEEGTFTEVGMTTNSDNLDYYISNMSKNVLLENEGGTFSQSAQEAGVENQYVEKDSSLSISWGTLFADVNNDMYLDLFISNGYVPAPAFVDNGNLEPDKLYINNTDGTFAEMDSSSGVWNEITSRGCAYSDVNNDGKVDIYSVVYDKPTFGLDGASCLYMNKSVNNNNWVKINLEGTQINRDGFGSKVYVYTGSDVQMRETSGGSSFCSHNSSTLHIGIGAHETVDSVVVKWTGGKNIQTVYDIDVNTLNNIKEKISTNTSDLAPLSLEFFPNPVKDHLTISLSINEINSIQIFTAVGKLVRTSRKTNHIDVSLLTKGNYIIQVSTNSGIKKGRFSKI
jgi:hypothetical protein